MWTDEGALTKSLLSVSVFVADSSGVYYQNHELLMTVSGVFLCLYLTAMLPIGALDSRLLRLITI